QGLRLHKLAIDSGEYLDPAGGATANNDPVIVAETLRFHGEVITSPEFLSCQGIDGNQHSFLLNAKVPRPHGSDGCGMMPKLIDANSGARREPGWRNDRASFERKQVIGAIAQCVNCGSRQG